jgi:hypothetical protein
MSHETPDDERFVEDEEEAAAAEAGHIGGDKPDYGTDEAHRAAAESGEGEQEGFELAEQDLVEEASHGDGGRDPAADVIDEDAGAERADSVYGEADEEEEPDL